MRFELRLLAILFCVCASIAMAQPAEETPAPILQDNGVGDPLLVDTTEPIVPRGEVLPQVLPSQAQEPPSAALTAPSDDMATDVAPSSVAAEPGEWTTQPDRRIPFLGTYEITVTLEAPASKGHGQRPVLNGARLPESLHHSTRPLLTQ